MEKLEHSLWLVQMVNALFGPLVAAALTPLGIEFAPGHDVIPDYIVMSVLILLVVSVLCLFIRTRLSVENPGQAARSRSNRPCRSSTGWSTISSGRRAATT